MLKKQDLLFEIEKEKDNFEVVLMVGAGDIELLVEPVVEILEKKE
jgi:UDP-N-acetylmuramate--alanine ligase